ncbi:MAG: hydrogenase iron-sulfur subunit [Desulfobacterales bacterium]|nr:hydrogenase iron-sulfur subunit [Desulfobacterales bacterium]
MTTVIFGAGKTARQIAEKAAALGRQAILVTEDRLESIADAETLRSAASLSLLTETHLKGCNGGIGDFTLELQQNGGTKTVKAARLILAEPDRRTANYGVYGLAPSDAVICLSELKARIGDPAGFGWPEQAPKHLVFLHGISTESTPAIAEEVMTAAVQLQEAFGVQTYVLVGNLKVAADGLEALYRKCRQAGAFFIKFTDTSPDLRQDKDGTVVVEYADEITQQRFTIRPDMTVVDETIEPSEKVARLARLLDLEIDENGFAQADNVHRWTVGTNRRGVHCVGPSRGILSREEKALDAANAAAALARESGDPPADRAVIDRGLCIRCLTCFRLCPYRAIRFTEEERVEAMAEACERCGICAAECPRTAITIPGLGRKELMPERSAASDAPVRITAFCCSQSAKPAGQYARRMGRDLPAGLDIVEVPCAGTVSLPHLMDAFARGAGGVMVLSCHPDNCHSREGNMLAKQRVELLRSRLEEIGFDPKRLSIRTLASNMGVEFGEAVEAFEKMLVDLA